MSPSPGLSVDGLVCRPVTGDDEPFLFALYASTRAEELAMVDWGDAQKEQFLRQQFNAQQTHYQSYFPDGEHQIVTRDGSPVGRIYLEQTAEKIHLLDIALIPAYRGQGIGSALMHALLEKAGMAGLPITLHVYRFDESVYAWYQRLGFVTVGGSGLYYLMEWRPQA